ncbi:hypothetical protein [Arcanobacterium ihumii]
MLGINPAYLVINALLPQASTAEPTSHISSPLADDVPNLSVRSINP